MASLALYLKPYHQKTPQTILKSAPSLTFSHLFSSSSSDGNNNDGGNASKPSNFSSYFSDIKSRLKQQEQHQNQSMGLRPFKFTPQVSSTPPKVASLDEIRKNLSEYRLRSAVPAPESSSPPGSEQIPSLQDLYKRNMAMSNPNPNPGRENIPKGNLSFEKIRESVLRLRTSKGEKGKTGSDRLSLDKYKDSFKLGSPMVESGGGGMVYGGSTERLPFSVFGKELSEREKMKRGDGKESAEDDMRHYELIKMYSHAELGEKLRKLRPEPTENDKAGKESWFSLTELNERLKKLREIEEKQTAARGTGISFGELRSGLQKIQLSQDANARKAEYPRVDILGQLGGTPAFMLSPPKEHLVEKYFHPDNMSAEEKLKLELKKVRDEFKMHESDCGSARVQVAQLTTEISHLSTVLHKKDKHSRRGLLAKVQQRKKLLKYLRRTDWDSYCLVLSKLGLRDNPDYKN